MERHLAAILAADVAGYSRLMERDEADTFERLRAHRKELFEPEIARHHGRIFKLMGDGLLAEFGSVTDAVTCAAALQRGMALRNQGIDTERRIEVRMAVTLGDVIVEGDDRYGEGVNIAARLQQLANPGEICVSQTVIDHVGNKLPFAFAPMGDHQVKNIERPIRVYRVDAPSPAPPAALRQAALQAAPSIVVLPFTNMSGDPEQEYFSDGITEDIITDLSYFKEFFVIARNTSFTYKGKPMRVGHVCRDLNVRYLLEGSVRKAGNNVRVTAQLIDGATEAHIWAARYDRQLDNIFQVQDEIRESIVTSVAPETMGAESRRSQAMSFDDLNVWEQVLRARWHVNKLTKLDNESAERILAAAIVRAPRFAPAHSTRAACLLSNVLHAWTESIAATIAAAHDSARIAVSLDAGDANALAAMGIASLFARKHEHALEYLNRAIRLNPNLAAAHGYLAAVHGSMGNSEAASAAAERAIRISPLDPARPLWFAGKGIGAFINGRYDDVIAICQEVLREHPNFGSALRQLAAAYAMKGDMTHAALAMDQLLQRMPALTVTKVRQIVPVMDTGAQERWLDGLRKAGLPE
jgi:TolB-like protein/Flp pilus assembly protein TadD